VKPYRTVLFIPAHKTSWFDRAVEAGPDAVVFDLEDSVPADIKTQARNNVAQAVAQFSASHPNLGLFVRVNPLSTRLTGKDLDAVIRPGLTGIFAPKINAARDVIQYDALVDFFEAEHGVEGLEYIVPVETIHGIQNCEAVAGSSPRVGAVIGPTAEHADIARAVGFEWSPEGLESLVHRTKILLATRAAGRHPLTALWERIHDLDGLREFATQGRKMGFRGQIVLHPSHVPVVNAVYTPPAKTIDFYRGLVQTYKDAEARGDGAVMYGDIHVDKAHADKATEWLARVDELEQLNGGI
jgi:citrate lyase subunit beta/citryl-CoA lyase